MSEKKTHEQFLKDVGIKNPHVEILGHYTNNATPIEIRCKYCEETYTSTPLNILGGRVHRKCVRKVRAFYKPKGKSHNVFMNEIATLGKNIEILTKYVNQKTKILVRCKTCGLERWALPQALTRATGTGCPVCSINESKTKMRSSHEEFIDKLYKINPHIEVLDEYVDNRTKIKIKCNNCGHIEYASPDKLLSRIYNCKSCSDNISFPNRFMASILDELHINYTPEKVFDWSNNKRYDFYLPDYNMIIEMHGDQHYKKDMYRKTVLQEQKNDNYKYDIACSNGIEKYISVDSSNSSFDFIWNNLLNEDFFKNKLDKVDKQTVLERCLSTSKIIELSKYYNRGITKNVDLQKCLGVSKNTVSSYMKRAVACNLIQI